MEEWISKGTTRPGEPTVGITRGTLVDPDRDTMRVVLIYLVIKKTLSDWNIFYGYLKL